MSPQSIKSTRSSSAYAHDKLFGQTELAEFCEYTVNELFCIPVCRPGIDTPPLSPVVGEDARKEPPSLVEFIAYALYRTRLPLAITHQALYLLKKLKSRYPSARGTASSPHRLFLSALMLSSKVSMDDTYSNKSWVIVGGNFFPLKEVNQMERELFAFLDFKLTCANEELSGFVRDAQIAYKFRHCQAGRLASSSSSSSLESLDQRKRRRSDTLLTEQAVQAEQLARHRRAADAAIALLRPPVAQQARLRSSHRRRATFCDSASSSSSSSSSSSPTYRDSSSSSSMYSSAATSPNVSTPCSPNSASKHHDLLDTCKAFNSMFVPSTVVEESAIPVSV